MSVDDECDYLVVGAGASGLSFIDTLLTEKPTATVILVDRNKRPGGHWTTSYPFVKLHQHSCFYGVNSERLGKNLDGKGNEIFDYDDRATGEEIVEYYEKVVEKFKINPKFKAAHFECEYRQEESSSSISHVYSVLKKNGDVLRIRCKKLVTIHSKVVVPSMRAAPFPVHHDVHYVPVNDLTEAKASSKYTNYVILGAGKTSIDAVLELLRSGVDQSSIKWVISRDVWFFVRDKVYPRNRTQYESASHVMDNMLAAPSVRDFFLKMESEGKLGRLNADREEPPPRIVKGPQLYSDELLLLRTVKDVVRLGRVKAIEAGGVLIFHRNDDDGGGELREELSSDNDSTVFVDCMAEEFYGYGDFAKSFKIFEPSRINLGPFVAVFNTSFSAALVAYMESRIADNETKNFCCFWGTADDSDLLFFDSFYCQIKTIVSLVRVHPPSMLFVLYSRTNSDAVIFHGGMSKFLWAQFGPRMLQRKVNKLIEKIERGGFSDFKPDLDVVNRTMPQKEWDKKARRVCFLAMFLAASVQVYRTSVKRS